MKEADFQTRFNKWAKYFVTETQAYELKLCKGTSMPFSAVAKHQYKSLHTSKHGVFAYKIADVGFARKPYDGFVLCGVPAYVYIMFYRRGQKEFIRIDIDVLIKEKKTSNRKSLTEERAKEIGDVFSL